MKEKTNRILSNPSCQHPSCKMLCTGSAGLCQVLNRCEGSSVVHLHVVHASNTTLIPAFIFSTHFLIGEICLLGRGGAATVVFCLQLLLPPPHPWKQPLQLNHLAAKRLFLTAKLLGILPCLPNFFFMFMACDYTIRFPLELISPLPFRGTQALHSWLSTLPKWDTNAKHIGKSFQSVMVLHIKALLNQGATKQLYFCAA